VFLLSCSRRIAWPSCQTLHAPPTFRDITIDADLLKEARYARLQFTTVDGHARVAGLWCAIRQCCSRACLEHITSSGRAPDTTYETLQGLTHSSHEMCLGVLYGLCGR
jgi:hypothetical protein